VPLDPLTGWNTTRDLPRVLQSEHVAIPAISNTASYAFASPNARAEAAAERNAAANITSHVPIGRPELAFVSQRAGRDGDARSGRHRRDLCAIGGVSNTA
jgi:hypothetical protein